MAKRIIRHPSYSQPSYPREGALRVRCPACASPAGKKCITWVWGSGYAPCPDHVSRKQAASQLEEQTNG